MPRNDTRPCPFCAETIQAAAVLCRFCQRNVPPVKPTFDPLTTDVLTGKPARQASLGQVVALLFGLPDTGSQMIFGAVVSFCFVASGGFIAPRFKTAAAGAAFALTALFSLASTFAFLHPGDGNDFVRYLSLMSLAAVLLSLGLSLTAGFLPLWYWYRKEKE